MENIRENLKCCGSEGGVKSAFPYISKSIAIERSKEAENTDYDLIVSFCLFCKLNPDKNSLFEVLDLSEFVLNHIEDNNSETSISEEIEGYSNK